MSWSWSSGSSRSMAGRVKVGGVECLVGMIVDTLVIRGRLGMVREDVLGGGVARLVEVREEEDEADFGSE